MLDIQDIGDQLREFISVILLPESSSSRVGLNMPESVGKHNRKRCGSIKHIGIHLIPLVYKVWTAASIRLTSLDDWFTEDLRC
jgi:hypothetical protein